MHPRCTCKVDFTRNINVLCVNGVQEAAGSNPVTRTKMLAAKCGKIVSVLPLFVAFLAYFTDILCVFQDLYFLKE
nr:MAG TPA: hypothetical protein [Caudoviricetes sp.]